MPRNEKAPAFQVYAADELADAALMTREEFGTWHLLKCIAWRDKGLPMDRERLCVVLGVKPRAFDKLWAVVGAQFVERDGRYVLPWMENQRDRHAALRERNAENGLHGGRPKNPPPTPNGTQPEPSGLAKPNPDESTSSFKLLGSRKDVGGGDARETTADRPAPPPVVPLAVALARAANQAVTEAWGEESPNPYVATSGVAVALAEALARDGIPPDFAERAVFTACRAFCVAARERGDRQQRPSALSYFGPAVRRAWDEHRAGEDAAAHPTPAALPDVRGFARPDPVSWLRKVAAGEA